MTFSPTGELDRWLYTTLSGDGTLAGVVSYVGPDPAPPGTATPFVVWSHVPFGHQNAYEDRRIISTGEVWVRVWTSRTDPLADIETAVTRIDALLHGANVVTGPVEVAMWQDRESRLASSEGDDIREARGGWFRYTVTAA